MRNRSCVAGVDAAIGEIAARLGAGAGGERGLEELGGELDHVMQGLAALGAHFVLARDFRHRQAGE